MTPLQRLLAAGVLSPAQQAELTAYRDNLNPAKIAREIADLQNGLLILAKEKLNSSTWPASPTPCPTSAKVSGPKLPEAPIFAGIFT